MLVLHELDLEMLVALIMVGHQVVDALKKCSRGARIILPLSDEFFLRKHLHEVYQAIAGLAREVFRVWRDVSYDRDDTFVDGL